MADQVDTLRITADGKAALQVINEFPGAERRMGTSGRQAGEAASGGARQMAQSFKIAGTAAVDMRAQVYSIKRSVLKFGAAFAGLPMAHRRRCRYRALW